MDWNTAHAFRRAVEEGKTRPIICPECENMVVLSSGKDFEPVFKCYTCNVVYNIGLDVESAMRAAVQS